MRTELAKLEEERFKVWAVFERYGSKTNYHGFPDKTILLKNITDCDGKILTDHLWFNNTKGIQKLGELNAGDVIEFEARVLPYCKGYVNNREYIDEREIDYKLSHPTKFRKIQSC
ncbi:MAG: hypothetical protein WC390_06675 [Sulfurimonas sp.]|jgi:hypothetical protein